MPNINTLNSVKGDDDDKNSDDEGRQGFFVGGSDHSGQQVLGPQGRDREGRLADQVFDAAKRAGAEVLDADESARIHERMHQGTSGQSSGHSVSGRQDPSAGTVEVRINFWQDGFSVDEEPLRSYEEPANRLFMEQLRRGRIPAEIEAAHRGRKVDIHLLRHESEYRPPPMRPFGGTAHRVGGITPTVVGGGGESMPSANLGTDEAQNLLAEAQKDVKLDADKPKGKIQIRQPNGNRLVGEFNESHLVEDVRTFIATALPDFAATPFRLHTTYPNKPIEDESQTVAATGILNAVVLIKVIAV